MTTLTQPAPPAQRAALPSTLVVRVTEEDVALGARRNGRECPIARATRRTLALMGYGERHVLVGGIANGNSVVSISNALYRDRAIPDFITAYDCSGPVEPTTFTLVRL